MTTPAIIYRPELLKLHEDCKPAFVLIGALESVEP